MNKYSLRSVFLKSSAVLVCTAVAAALTGCGVGPTLADNSTDTVAPAIHGVLHGGASPDVGARVVLYATTSTGYGTGAFLQEATQKGASTHQDTDSTGTFIFAGGYTCPAGQYAYVVAYGGNTGGFGVNPNTVLMAAIGQCSSLSSSTNIVVNEASTAAAAYALSNFIGVTGNASAGYTVGVGAPATNNNGSTGCVSNAYYTTAACPATAAAGLGHAFSNAISLVNASTGVVNATTTNGATIPTVEINTLADAVQACVNSAGGGTNGSGLPTTTTTASGTSHDGTVCGKLFAFTSYTSNGLPTGTGSPAATLTAAGDTLDALIDLVKRPTGSASTFNTTCDSNSGSGTTPATTCVFNLASGVSASFVPALTVAPSDWMVGISYPKGGLSNSTTSTFTTGSGCASTTTNNGLLYPAWVQADINDDILILNTDQSTPVCANVIEIGPDGTVVAANAIYNDTAKVVSLGLDGWGHVMLPYKGGTAANGLGIRVFQYQPVGATFVGGDNSLSLAQTILSSGTNNSAGTTQGAFAASYVQADSNSRLWVASQNAFNDFGYYTITQSHTAPAYAWTSLSSTTTSNVTSAAVDINNNAFTTNSTQATGTGGTNYAKGTANGGTSSTNFAIGADTSGNLWDVFNNGATVGTSQTQVMKYPYTSSSGSLTWGANSVAYSFPTSTNTTSLNGGLATGAKAAVMDGNNVLWFADFFGQATTSPTYSSWLRGYDTVNNYGTPQLLGCKFFSPGNLAITAWSISGSNTIFTTSASTPPPVGAIISLSAFTTSTFFNNTGQFTVSANSTGPSTFTIASNFGQGTSSNTETGTATGRAATACGNNVGDTSNPSNSPFLFYATRGITVDSMGNLWVANGTQGQVNEILGIAAPTWPNYIHNGTSNKP